MYKDLLLATNLKLLIGVFQKFKIIHVKGKLTDGADYMSRQGGNQSDLSYQNEASCQHLEMGRISSFGQQLDDALVASLRAALTSTEGLGAFTWVREGQKEPMDALLTTNYRERDYLKTWRGLKGIGRAIQF